MLNVWRLNGGGPRQAMYNLACRYAKTVIIITRKVDMLKFGLVRIELEWFLHAL